jgi:hypothetical protein
MVAVAGSSVEKETARQGPADAIDRSASTGGVSSASAAASKIPTTPPSSAAPPASVAPAPITTRQATAGGSRPASATR